MCRGKGTGAAVWAGLVGALVVTWMVVILVSNRQITSPQSFYHLFYLYFYI